MAETSKNRLQVSELDFDQIKSNLKTYMSSQAKFQDYDFEGSAMSTLLDVLAYNTFYNSFNSNMLANEMYLDTAQVRNNVVSHAKSLGYVPRSKSAAAAVVNVEVLVPGGLPSSLTIDRGTTFATKIDNRSYTFVVTETSTITPNSDLKYIFSNIEIKQGKLKTFTYMVDSTDSRQRFEIPDSNIDTSSLLVTVRSNASSSDRSTYARVENVVEVNGASEVYFLQEGLDSKYEIYFGDNIFGKRLEAGNVIEANYLVTDGDEANGAASFTLSSNISGNTNVVVTTVSSATGGASAEDIESIKFNAPLSFLSQNRVVTADDYRTIIKNNYSNAETVTAWGGEENEPPEYGKVYISIKPRTGTVLSDVEKQFVVDSILKPKNIVSITPEIIDPSYTYIYLEVFFKYNPNLTTRTSGDLKALVTSVIENYNVLALRKFDGVFRHSALTRRIDEADPSILNSTVRVYMRKLFTPTIGVSQKYELYFSSPLYITSSNESIISSSGFYINGQLCYLESYQTGSTTDTHKIRIFRLNTNQEKVVVVSDAGFIDSARGLVVLSAFNPDGGYVGPHIHVNASPDSNDIAPKLNQLLEIDMTNTTVTPEVDTVATGGVVAGIGYKTTPRHKE
jgi:hypothetical protein